MIAVFIFFLHMIGVAYGFSKTYYEHKLSEAFLTLAFFLIIFTVGWTIAAFIVSFTVPGNGWPPFFDSDTISLVIVTLLEAILYSFLFKGKKKHAEQPA